MFACPASRLTIFFLRIPNSITPNEIAEGQQVNGRSARSAAHHIYFTI
jgi:hypothetical protein